MSSSKPSAIQAPVTVIGAGPAGLATSLLLCNYNVPHVLVEKYRTMAHTPRAHIINQRTVEILRDLRLESRFRDIAMPWDMMTNVVWHMSLAGLEIARRQGWGTAPDRRGEYVRASPCSMGNCGQHLLEPMLLRSLEGLAEVDLRLNHELLDLAQDDSGVTATVIDRTSGERSSIRSQYLVGADGARSAVARSIGLQYEGEEGISSSATIHFHADLSRFTAYRPGALYWNASPGSGNFRGLGTLICHQPWSDWALAFSYDPDSLDPTDRGLAVERLHRVIGDPTVEIDIKNITSWTINRLIATSYSAGRVFCMGDAVHRHPPTNGLGLNTSVADAYNLAWKLAFVVKGVAGEGLLDTYSAERQPVGRAVVNRAFRSIADMRPITEALGFANGQSDEEGREAVAGLFAPGADGAHRRKQLAAAVAHTDYQFNAHGVEVGYRYRQGALVSDGTPEPSGTRDADLYYVPTTWPGAHLPHAWIDRGEGRLSTYDVAGAGRFVLLSGIGGSAWKDAAIAAQEETGVPIEVVFIGTPDGYRDVYGDWALLSEVSESGCVLVRPDLHVAWRAPAATAAALERLPVIMKQLLSHG
jgi:2,4-dichlorophenol 6-monooxygenase